MSGSIGFKTVLFYVMLSLATAAPTATTLPASTVTTPSTTTAASPTTIVPPFQCSTLSNSEYERSVSLLYAGLSATLPYVAQNLNTGEQCSPNEARTSIFLRQDERTLTPELGFAILQAYSTIAQFASQSNVVSEADQRKMQIVHELLNSLITNYYEVVSPNHCSCAPAPSDSCVTIPNLDFLVLDSYPDSCSPAAYVSINLISELVLIDYKFQDFAVDNGLNFGLISCQQWKDTYLSSDSLAASTFTCPN